MPTCSAFFIFQFLNQPLLQKRFRYHFVFFLDSFIFFPFFFFFFVFLQFSFPHFSHYLQIERIFFFPYPI
jgi:hypothetical protein